MVLKEVIDLLGIGDWVPQNCSRIHYPLSLTLSSKKKQNEWGDNNFSFSRNYIDICCFDYLINIEEYYSDNLLQNSFYYQFTKIIYDFDKKNIFDFAKYNKDSLVQFIKILNKACCFYYTQEKIKYSKYLSNLSVRILQNYLKNHIINNNINNTKSNKKINYSINELKNNNIISNIYNNASCNYFKTFSYDKSSKFLEYSNKNVEENDINNKLIYYNNALILSSKNKTNDNNNIDNIIKTLSKLISTKKKYFDNIYNNNGYGNDLLKNGVQKNEENYNSFKLLCFIMYNHCYAIDKLLNQKNQAKKLYQSSFDYISKYLGKNSLEAEKFLYQINYDKGNNILNFDNKSQSIYYSNYNENRAVDDEVKRRNLTPVNIRKSKKLINNYDIDIDLRLRSILEKIEDFEEILTNKELIDNIILKEKQLNNDISKDEQIYMSNHNKNSNNNNESYNNKNNENKNDNILRGKRKTSSIEEKNDNNINKNENKTNTININKNIIGSNTNNTNNITNNTNNNKENNIKNEINIKNDNNTENKKDENTNKDNSEENKKSKIREKITFDMMDNIIEEFKKESQEKLEQQKKLKEEKEKERKLKEEKDKTEKDKINEKNEIKIKIDKVSDNPTEAPPKKVPRIKKLFQKVLGTREKEPPKTMLGELFQSLMKRPEERKKDTNTDIGGKEIKFGNESESKNNFINLDDEE